MHEILGLLISQNIISIKGQMGLDRVIEDGFNNLHLSLSRSSNEKHQQRNLRIYLQHKSN